MRSPEYRAVPEGSFCKWGMMSGATLNFCEKHRTLKEVRGQ